MSVINKMLQDLDKRGAAAPGGVEGTAQSPPAPSPGSRRRAGGREIAAWALVVLLAVGGVSVALWFWPESPDEELKKGPPAQVAEVKPAPAAQPAPAVQPAPAAVTTSEPKPVEAPPKPEESPPKPEVAPSKVEEIPAPKPPASAAPAAPTATAPAPPPPTPPPAPASPPSVAKTPPTPAPAAVVAQASVAPPPMKAKPAAPKPAAPVEEPKVERRAPERKEGTITISKRPPAPAPLAAAEKTAPKARPKVAEAKVAPPVAREVTEPPAKPAAAPEGPVASVTKPAPAVEDKGSISIEKQESSRAELATREFRSALDLMNQGRVELALGTFAGALRLDPKHVATRQTMVVLLLERGRLADAQSVLRDGLAALPGHVEWAMLLARIQVDAGDAAGALATLEQALPHAKDRPDYHAFTGTLLQMQGRHRDAIASYEIAVRLSPTNGRWLTGLAISLEEEKRVPEAREAYGRALATRTLGQDLQAFVERKLGQLQ